MATTLMILHDEKEKKESEERMEMEKKMEKKREKKERMDTENFDREADMQLWMEKYRMKLLFGELEEL